MSDIALAVPRIESVNYVVEFGDVISDIRYKQKEIEDVFGSFAGVQSTQTNVPDAVDPSIPRIVFEGRRKISISKTRCSIVFDFKKRGFNWDKIKEIIERDITEYYELCKRAFNVIDHSALACSVEIDSRDDLKTVNSYLFDSFLKTPKIGPVASLQTRVGFEVDGHFVNFAVQGFETRVANLEARQHNIIKVEDMKVVGQGVLYQIEVNNKPLSSKVRPGIAGSAAGVLASFNKFVTSDFVEFSGVRL